MKLFFASIFTAVVSVPAGILSAVMFFKMAVHQNLGEAAVIGGQVNGFLLFVALVLFLCSMVTVGKRV